jgi:hypothetical protein
MSQIELYLNHIIIHKSILNVSKLQFINLYGFLFLNEKNLTTALKTLLKVLN